MDESSVNGIEMGLYPLVMTNIAMVYLLKMGGCSMAMLNNQMVTPKKWCYVGFLGEFRITNWFILLSTSLSSP